MKTQTIFNVAAGLLVAGLGTSTTILGIKLKKQVEYTEKVEETLTAFYEENQALHTALEQIKEINTDLTNIAQAYKDTNPTAYMIKSDGEAFIDDFNQRLEELRGQSIEEAEEIELAKESKWEVIDAQDEEVEPERTVVMPEEGFEMQNTMEPVEDEEVEYVLNSNIKPGGEHPRHIDRISFHPGYDRDRYAIPAELEDEYNVTVEDSIGRIQAATKQVEDSYSSGFFSDAYAELRNRKPKGDEWIEMNGQKYNPYAAESYEAYRDMLLADVRQEAFMYQRDLESEDFIDEFTDTYGLTRVDQLDVDTLLGEMEILTTVEFTSLKEVDDSYRQQILSWRKEFFKVGPYITDDQITVGEVMLLMAYEVLDQLGGEGAITPILWMMLENIDHTGANSAEVFLQNAKDAFDHKFFHPVKGWYGFAGVKDPDEVGRIESMQPSERSWHMEVNYIVEELLANAEM